MDDPMIAKTPPSLSSRRRRAAPRRGVALLLVLGCLVLLVALIVGLLVSAQNNLKSSKLYANGSSVRALADSTVSLVMAQIQQATSNGTTVAWASQPGMIRTYGSDGKPKVDYRLFSWDSPIWDSTAQGANYNPANDVSQLSTWSSTPGIFVDLNQPVADTSGTLHYPILDGNSADLTSYTLTATLPSQPASVLTYTNNGVTPAIEGFYVTPGVAATTTQNSVPMPVKWLYVLRDGSVVAPAAGTTGSTITIAGASQSNPIVGRIAYWTDDETSKININTASEGNFWDTPRTQGVTDFALADYQPVQNEFQRYPGHPATTCLSSVFNSVSTASLSLTTVNHALDASVSSYTGATSATLYAPYQFYYDLAPKLNLNQTGNTYDNLGSMAGSRVYSTSTSTTTAAALAGKNDRLYASPDELLFQSGLVSGSTTRNSVSVGATTGSSVARVLSSTTTTGTTTISPAFLEKAKFFITSSSRAPDVNLFNQPRIVCWPVSANTSSTYRTIWDQTIAECGTIGNSIYYFQRQRNDHPTNDLPTTATTTSVGRNRALYQYLQNLTSQNIPGFGGNFSTKYPSATTPPPLSATVSERDQILTEIFDYIRCLDLVDGSLPTVLPANSNAFAPAATGANYTANGAGTYTTAAETSAGYGQVVPIYDATTKTRGFGRFPSIQEVSLIFITTGWNDGNGGNTTTDINYKATAANANTPSWGYDSTITGATTSQPLMKVQAALLISFFDPSQGYQSENNTFAIQVSGLDALQWSVDNVAADYGSMGFPSAPAAPAMVPSTGSQYMSAWGGNMGWRYFITGIGAPSYPYISSTKIFPYSSTTGGTFWFQGGPITVNLLLPSTTPGWPPAGWPVSGTPTPLQSIKISFPVGPTQLPLPTEAYSAQNNNAPTTPARQDRDSFATRFAWSKNNYSANCEFISSDTSVTTSGGAYGDTVRSVRAYPGDIRMIAGLPAVADTATSPVASASNPGYFDSTETEISAAGMSFWNYSSSTQHLVHDLRESIDYPFMGAIMGQLVPTVAYSGGSTTGNPYGANGPPYDRDINPPNSGSFGFANFSGAGNNATTKGAFIGGGTSGSPGDWDNGFGCSADGPYINKADEGDLNFSGGIPYFSDSNYSHVTAGSTYFTPNRLMPGPGMFGSLPTGVIENIPWKTLLFCANPAAGPSHPGFGVGSGTSRGANDVAPYSTPPDHLFLDLFNMPVVEPYPISEPLSTAGRINMNYQIVPFTYIERSTGMRAVLKAERMTVIPDNLASAYKNGGGTTFKINTTANGFSANYDYRVPINPDQTLLAFDNYFSTNLDIFRSASQICQMFFYPTKDAVGTNTNIPTWDSANANIMKFWNGTNTAGTAYTVSTAAASVTHYITGDNSRERPYTTIYPRLTTKSNTFTIHYYVQTLKQAETANSPASAWGTWREGTDLVTGEYRGASLIERYVDPNDPSLSTVDFTASGAPALDSWYKFRVISNTQFAP
jgi:uncharacterized protein (TIGR02600 family)